MKLQRTLRGLDTSGRFFVIHLYKGDNICDSLFAFLHTSSFCKEVYPKRKEFAPVGAKSFLLE